MFFRAARRVGGPSEERRVTKHLEYNVIQRDDSMNKLPIIVHSTVQCCTDDHEIAAQHAVSDPQRTWRADTSGRTETPESGRTCLSASGARQHKQAKHERAESGEGEGGDGGHGAPCTPICTCPCPGRGMKVSSGTERPAIAQHGAIDGKQIVPHD